MWAWTWNGSLAFCPARLTIPLRLGRAAIAATACALLSELKTVTDVTRAQQTGDPNNAVRFKDHASAGELTAEIMRQLSVLIEGGVIDLEALPASKGPNSELAGFYPCQFSATSAVCLCQIVPPSISASTCVYNRCRCLWECERQQQDQNRQPWWTLGMAPVGFSKIVVARQRW
jgi:hypothetical protein